MSTATADNILTVEKVRNMNLSQCMAESKSRWEQAAAIEKKYPDGVTPDAGEDYTQTKRLLSEIDLIETRTQELEEAGNRAQRIRDNVAKHSRPVNGHQQPQGDAAEAKSNVLTMIGQQFISDPEYKRIIESGVLNNPQSRIDLGVQFKGTLLPTLARKALVYSASGQGGNLITNDRLPGYQEILQRQLTLLDLIPTTQTTSNMIEYVKEKTFTNNAAEVAEATATTGTTGTKPESVLNFELATSPVQTIAHWIPVTNQMLSDAPQIRGIIDNRLVYGLNQRLETEILNGDGNTPNLAGILGSGIQTLGLAAGATYGGQANVVDAAYAAMVQVQVTGLANPNAFVFDPVDWAAVRLMRESAVTGNVNPGSYLYGPPSVSGPMTLWGRPVVEAIGMVDNTMLVGDFQLGCMLFDREQSTIRVGLINDQFIRNMQTILAEMRAAFVVFRPTAFARVTGV
ncbi:MAG TPA: phage major capsid protein [Thermomicrobiales bacterium]|nr:phage major capsid protein [Thermomicrobiales bacterium]